MNDLNNDFVLWISAGAVLLSVVSFIVFAWKTTRAIEGLEEGNDTAPEPTELEEDK
jgi:hypothetical protein